MCATATRNASLSNLNLYIQLILICVLVKHANDKSNMHKIVGFVSESHGSQEERAEAMFQLVSNYQALPPFYPECK